ncbi:MAG: class I SAM-dependent methyltransferase [Solirubrobacteraceae bacterium]
MVSGRNRTARYGRRIRDYYEDLWEGLTGELEPPLLGPRLAFLRDEVRPGDRALDLGCGTGEFTAALAEAGAQAVGADVAEAALARARARNLGAHPLIDFRLVPIDGPLPFEVGAFDLVWASEVIEHVADTARWLSEVRRVLAPRGRLLITTPSHGRLLLAIGGIERYSEPLGDHLHLYSKRSLRSLLDDFGFAAIEVRAVDGPPLLKRSLFARASR